LERILNEKTVQINELMKEGEQLAQSQLKANTAIKQLRAKEKESKKSERVLSEKNEQLNSQLERLRNDLRARDDIVRELTSQLEHLTKITQTQEAELQTVKVQCSHSESSLQEKENQIDGLKRDLLGLQNQLTEAEARAEHGARSSASEQALREQLDATRIECNSLKRSSDERNSQWREERDYYQVPESQKTAEVASESERVTRQLLCVTEKNINELNSNLTNLRAENQRLQERLDTMNKQLLSERREKSDLSSQLAKLTAERRADTDSVRELRAQLQQERAAHEITMHESKLLENQIRQLRDHAAVQSNKADATDDVSSQCSNEVNDPFSIKNRTETTGVSVWLIRSIMDVGGIGD
uniref:Nucleoprotein TPR n=1 Tax=Echinostoma caproni TaxID=27848 RepID=A0A183API6_9TREM